MYNNDFEGCLTDYFTLTGYPNLIPRYALGAIWYKNDNYTPGQQIVVDTGNVAGFEPTVSMDIRQVPGLKNKFLGGEGLFNTLLTGPGKVWLQTMPISNVALAIRPFIPTGNG